MSRSRPVSSRAVVARRWSVEKRERGEKKKDRKGVKRRKTRNGSPSSVLSRGSTSCRDVSGRSKSREKSSVANRRKSRDSLRRPRVPPSRGRRAREDAVTAENRARGEEAPPTPAR